MMVWLFPVYPPVMPFDGGTYVPCVALAWSGQDDSALLVTARTLAQDEDMVRDGPTSQGCALWDGFSVLQA